MQRTNQFESSQKLHPVVAAIVGLTFFLPLAGCVVAGLSNSVEAFLWPGGLGLMTVVLVTFLSFSRK